MNDFDIMTHYPFSMIKLCYEAIYNIKPPVISITEILTFILIGKGIITMNGACLR